MALPGKIDSEAAAINRARAKLLAELRQADDFGKRDKSDLASAIDEFVAAMIADAMDRRY